MNRTAKGLRIPAMVFDTSSHHAPSHRARGAQKWDAFTDKHNLRPEITPGSARPLTYMHDSITQACDDIPNSI